MEVCRTCNHGRVHWVLGSDNVCVNHALPYHFLQTLNAHWDWLDATEISLSGVMVCYARSSHAHRWEGFSHAVVGRNVIASIPVTQSATLVLVSKSVLQIESCQQTKDDRDSILDVVKKKL